MTFGKRRTKKYFLEEIQSSRDYSEVTARMIDEEISRIVRESQRFADEILRKDIDILHRIAKELLKYETIDAKDLEKILKGEKLTRALNGSSLKKCKKNQGVNTLKETIIEEQKHKVWIMRKIRFKSVKTS